MSISSWWDGIINDAIEEYDTNSLYTKLNKNIEKN